MKGVVLAGGKGTRLRPMTHVVNKHLLPVYDEPLIYYPVKTLRDAGIDDIMIISNAEYIGRFIQLLEQDFPDIDFTFRVQSAPKGIAHGVGLAEDFVDDTVAVMLGDNIILDDLSDAFNAFEESSNGCRLFLKEVSEPARYGIAEMDDGDITSLVEKPDDPSSTLAVTGIYLYDSTVFDKIDRIEPSDRGELEITDVNKLYVADDDIAHTEIDGEWYDAGTPEGLFQASQYARKEKGAQR